MYDHAGRAPFDEPSGREVRGWGTFYRCYRAADRWMFFAAPAERHGALARVPELRDLAGSDASRLEDSLAERFAGRPLEFWAQALGGRSSCVVPLSSLGETRDAALQRESGGDIDLTRATFRTIHHDRHPMGRWVDLVAPNAVRPDNARIRIPAPAPKYGRDTSRVLRRLGYGDDEIAVLRERRVVADRWSERYLPE